MTLGGALVLTPFLTSVGARARPVRLVGGVALMAGTGLAACLHCSDRSLNPDRPPSRLSALSTPQVAAMAARGMRSSTPEGAAKNQASAKP
jgi:hypothetical protein